MQGFWWKLPGLRRLSPLSRGVTEAWWVTLVLSLAALSVIHTYGGRPSEAVLTGMAQIGATLLVAYGVEISWVLKESRLRDAGRENWVGIAVGLGCGGLVGIGLALALSGAGETFSVAQELVFSVSIASISLLGFLVALGPLAVYEWAHAARVEYPDE